MIYAFFTIFILSQLFFMHIKHIRLSEKSAKIIWVILIIFLCLLAFQYKVNYATNFDSERHYVVLDALRNGGVRELSAMLRNGIINSLHYVTFYLFSFIPDNRIFHVVGVIVTYSVFGYVTFGIQKRISKKNRISTAMLFPAMFVFQMYCDYAYRVVDEYRNTLALAILVLGIYNIEFKGKKNIFVICAVLSVCFHGMCMLIILLYFIAVFLLKVKKGKLRIHWFFCLWQFFIPIVGNILVALPVSFLKYYGLKILQYQGLTEVRHWVYWCSMSLSMFILTLLIEYIMKIGKYDKSYERLLILIELVAIVGFGGYGTVIGFRIPIFIAFFAQYIVMEVSRIPQTKVVFLLNYSWYIFGVIVIIYWNLYMSLQLSLSAANWVIN